MNRQNDQNGKSILFLNSPKIQDDDANNDVLNDEFKLFAMFMTIISKTIISR